MVKQLTHAQLVALVCTEFHGPKNQALALIAKWAERGDGCAVYRNQDLGHPGCGSMQLVSFGSPAAQLETDTPPQRLPDIGGSINWRYQLEAIYRPLQSNPECL